MGLAQDLQAEALNLRKKRSDIAAGFQSVLGFAQASAKERGLKGGDPTINDEDALRAINRGIKMCRDTIDAAKAADPNNAAGNLDVVVPNDLLERTWREMHALEFLLPEMADETEVRAEIGRFIGGNPELVGSKKAMGDIMKFLNERFGASLDRPSASQIAKEVLNAANASA